jgi:hypothetical protein
MEEDDFAKFSTDGIEAAKKKAETDKVNQQVDKEIAKSDIKFEKKSRAPPRVKQGWERPTDELKQAVAREELLQRKKDKENFHRKNKVKRQARRLWNHDLFHEQLKTIKLPNETDPLEVWESTLDLIKIELNSQRAVDQLYSIIGLMAHGMEIMVKARPDLFKGVRLHHPISFSATVRSEIFRNLTIKEATQISIEYDEYLGQSPVTRMMMSLLQCAGEVSQKNINEIARAQAARPAETPFQPNAIEPERKIEQPPVAVEQPEKQEPKPRGRKAKQ